MSAKQRECQQCRGERNWWLRAGGRLSEARARGTYGTQVTANQVLRVQRTAAQQHPHWQLQGRPTGQHSSTGSIGTLAPPPAPRCCAAAAPAALTGLLRVVVRPHFVDPQRHRVAHLVLQSTEAGEAQCSGARVEKNGGREWTAQGHGRGPAAGAAWRAGLPCDCSAAQSTSIDPQQAAGAAAQTASQRAVAEQRRVGGRQRRQSAGSPAARSPPPWHQRLSPEHRQRPPAAFWRRRSTRAAWLAPPGLTRWLCSSPRAGTRPASRARATRAPAAAPLIAAAQLLHIQPAARLPPIAVRYGAAAEIGGGTASFEQRPHAQPPICFFGGWRSRSGPSHSASCYRPIDLQPARHGGPGGLEPRRPRLTPASGRHPSAGGPQGRAHGGAGCHPGLAGAAHRPPPLPP